MDIVGKIVWWLPSWELRLFVARRVGERVGKRMWKIGTRVVIFEKD